MLLHISSDLDLCLAPPWGAHRQLISIIASNGANRCLFWQAGGLGMEWQEEFACHSLKVPAHAS